MVVLIPNVSESVALQIAERFRDEVSALKRHFQDPLTLSVGIAVDAGQYAKADRLFDAADQALRKAKRLGKDQVQVAEML